MTAIAFLGFLIVLDRGLYVALDAAFRRTQTGEMTGGMVNRALAERADAVVLGSSRAWHHMDSAVLSERLGLSVYNAGCDGQGMPYVRGVADLLLRTCPPRLFIINIDGRTLVMSPDDYDRIATLSPFIDESPVVREMIHRRGTFEPLKYALSRSFRFNGKVLGIFKNLMETNTLVGGFSPLDRQFNPDTAQVEALRIEAGTSGAPPENDPFLKQLLVEVIESAKRSGVDVVLATGPRWTPDGRLDPVRKRLLSEVTDLGAKRGVPHVIMTTENTPVLRDATLYADTAHLNRRGARLYSELLADQLIELSANGTLKTALGRTRAHPAEKPRVAGQGNSAVQR